MNQSAADFASLRAHAHAIRRIVLQMCRGRGQGYAGQGLALADLMACLYFGEMRRSAEGFDDRLVLSTGHSAIAVFAALGRLGMYEMAELETYGMNDSRIEESPLEGIPGFDITGGSLGQGLSQAVGMALGLRMQGSDARVFCIVSDGELQEGQVWEAAMCAAHHKLSNLVVIVDNNLTQADGATAEVMNVESVDAKFEAFGLRSRRVSGNDLPAIVDALAWARTASNQPSALVCETTLGFGVRTFESLHNVHYVRAKAAFWDSSLAELDSDSGGVR